VNKIPVAVLSELYDELPPEPDMSARDKKALNTLERFLNGEFKSRISPTRDMYSEQ